MAKAVLPAAARLSGFGVGTANPERIYEQLNESQRHVDAATLEADKDAGSRRNRNCTN